MKHLWRGSSGKDRGGKTIRIRTCERCLQRHVQARWTPVDKAKYRTADTGRCAGLGYANISIFRWHPWQLCLKMPDILEANLSFGALKSAIIFFLLKCMDSLLMGERFLVTAECLEREEFEELKLVLEEHFKITSDGGYIVVELKD